MLFDMFLFFKTRKLLGREILIRSLALRRVDNSATARVISGEQNLPFLCEERVILTVSPTDSTIHFAVLTEILSMIDNDNSLRISRSLSLASDLQTGLFLADRFLSSGRGIDHDFPTVVSPLL